MTQEGSEPKEAEGAAGQEPTPRGEGEGEGVGVGVGVGVDKDRARRRRIQTAAAITVVLLAALPLGFAIDRAMGSGKVLRGVSAGGVSLEGMDRAEAQRAVDALAERIRQEPIRVRVRGQSFAIEPGAVGFHADAQKTVDAALGEGRRGGVLQQMSWWFGRFRSPVDVGVVTSIDDAPLDKAIAEWEAKAIDDPPFDGAVAVQGATPVPDYPRAGHGIDREGSRRVVRESLAHEHREPVLLPLVDVSAHLGRDAVDAAVERARSIVAGPVTLTAPVPLPARAGSEGGKDAKDAKDGKSAGSGEGKSGSKASKGGAPEPSEAPPTEVSARWSPQDLARAIRSRVVVGEGAPSPGRVEVDLDPIVIDEALRPLRPQLEIKPQDARFAIDDRDRVTILPSHAGTRLDAGRAVAAILAAASAPERAGALPVDVGEQPEFSTEAAAALRIDHLVSQHTTRHPCCQPRVGNIHRIADLIDGRVVRPGETLSLNAATGERTRANGYVLAPSIADGEMVDTMGGGVSQFATTFFNAMFYGGYDIIERQPHSFYFSRYPMGHEATLSWPKPDLIIRNDTEAGILIRTVYSKTSITVKLYGDNGGRKVRAKVSSKQDIVEPPVELIANPKLEPDEEKVKEHGQVGWSVIVARVLTFPDGTTKQERRKVTYKPRVRRIQVHPCRIPKGEEGYTGEPCPKPETAEGEEPSPAGTSAPPAPSSPTTPPPSPNEPAPF